MKKMPAYPAYKKILAGILLSVLALPVFSYDLFTEGERLFRENKPAEAAPLLYQASLSGTTDPKVFNYLGLCYKQTGKYADAISAFMKGTSAPGTDKKVLFVNAGNVYFVQNLFTEAEAMYSRAIGIDSAYAPAFLDRANARVKLEQYPKAVDDYTVYLTLDPASSQQEPIRKLVALLSNEIQTRAALAIKAEADKAAAEAEKKAAAERYQKMLDDVNSSLRAVDNASTLSAGSENVMKYTEDGKLE
jgi:tetratricopeptide (TPR) repeat protein